MKILLTGASGFVGSHILDQLLAARHRVLILLRPASDKRHVSHHLADVVVQYGGLEDVNVLKTAMQGVEAVIHCAGKTKALHPTEFYGVNHAGTVNVVSAANACRETLKQLIYISSQAVSGPGLVDRPARESDAPAPLTVYAHSKLQGESEVRRHCRVPWTVLRPAAVYGPRDTDFLSVFQTVKRRLMPLLAGAPRPLNLVYGPDVAAAVLGCLANDRALGGIYHVAAQPPCDEETLMREIAAQLGLQPLRLKIPRSALYLACLMQDIRSRMTGRPNILSRRKLPELLAPGWVCSTDRIQEDLGYTAPHSLREGVAHTLAWYGREGWL